MYGENQAWPVNGMGILQFLEIGSCAVSGNPASGLVGNTLALPVGVYGFGSLINSSGSQYFFSGRDMFSYQSVL